MPHTRVTLALCFEEWGELVFMKGSECEIRLMMKLRKLFISPKKTDVIWKKKEDVLLYYEVTVSGSRHDSHMFTWENC